MIKIATKSRIMSYGTGRQRWGSCRTTILLLQRRNRFVGSRFSKQRTSPRAYDRVGNQTVICSLFPSPTRSGVQDSAAAASRTGKSTSKVSSSRCAGTDRGRPNARPRQRYSPCLPRTGWAPPSVVNAAHDWRSLCQRVRLTTDQALQALQVLRIIQGTADLLGKQCLQVGYMTAFDFSRTTSTTS